MEASRRLATAARLLHTTGLGEQGRRRTDRREPE